MKLALRLVRCVPLLLVGVIAVGVLGWMTTTSDGRDLVLGNVLMWAPLPVAMLAAHLAIDE